MTPRIWVAALAVLLPVGGAMPAISAPFTWNPGAAGLTGTTVTADMLVLSDYAQIRFGDGGTTFVDTGYLPVIGLRLNGQAVAPDGFGTTWGAYISYVGTGTQVVTPQGVPVSATFQTLSYTIIAYDGVASFGFATDGSAVVGGGISKATPVEGGSLISGTLAFSLPPGQAAPTIVGHVLASVESLDSRFVESNPSALDVFFVHPPGEYFFSSQTTLQIAGGASSSATLARDTVLVGEPESATLLGAGLLALGAVAGRRRGRRPGQAA